MTNQLLNDPFNNQKYMRDTDGPISKDDPDYIKYLDSWNYLMPYYMQYFFKSRDLNWSKRSFSGFQLLVIMLGLIEVFQDP